MPEIGSSGLMRGDGRRGDGHRPNARQMLLGNAGIHFEAVPADIDERAVQTNSGLTSAGEIAGLLAREKALFVSSKNPGRYVIGADHKLPRPSSTLPRKDIAD